MRNRIVALVLLVVVGVGGLAPAASARMRTRIYLGDTPQGTQLAFQIGLKPTGRFVLIQTEFLPVLECEDGTTVTNHGYGYWTYPPPRLDGRRIDFASVGETSRVALHGGFGARRARGRMHFRIAAFSDVTGGTQVCSTGTFRWHARRVREPVYRAWARGKNFEQLI